MRLVLPGLLGLLLAGCPTLGDSLPFVPLGDVGPDGGPSRQPDVSGGDAAAPDATRFDMRPEPPPLDAAPPDATIADAAPDGTCPPGVWLGPCIVCGDDGEPTTPDDDDACPAIDCEALATFERFDDANAGYSVCWAEYRQPVGGRCRGLGDCHHDPDAYCAEVTEDELEVVWSDCQWLDGCEEGDPPELVREPPGAPCNGVGMCTPEGSCTANPACDGFVLPGASFFCAARDGAQPYCEFYLGDEVGMGVDCASFCGAHGWRCAGAWNSMVGMCVHDGVPAACGDRYTSFVCRCAPPD